MKFLITNDDGIDAAGLNALLDAAQNFGEATIVAPAAPQSGVSHAVTWHEGVRIEPRGEKRFAIHGTPADCIRLGLLHLVPDANWVLSGINHGANLGADVYYSGTAGPASPFRIIAKARISTAPARLLPSAFYLLARLPRMR
jgi:5'-nucleotidase